jgi:hypothetical protein
VSLPKAMLAVALAVAAAALLVTLAQRHGWM